MLHLRKFFLGCIVMAAMMGGTSCSSYKSALYMQESEVFNETSKSQLYDFRIMPKDELTIVVSTTDPEASAPFVRKLGQSKEFGGSSTTGMQNANLLSYLVDNNGYIDFPVLGLVKAAGLTRWELAKEIKGMIVGGNYIKDPVVTVEFMNFKISVMGEVTSPGTYNIEGDKITILQALSLARDLTIFGRRDNVSVIREQDGERVIYQVDLRSASIFESPAYYLQQNDIVYVEPNKVRAGQSTINENNIKSVSLWVSIGSFLTSLAVLVVNLVNVNVN